LIARSLVHREHHSDGELDDACREGDRAVDDRERDIQRITARNLTSSLKSSPAVVSLVRRSFVVLHSRGAVPTR
jgi:hypothetical protein